MKYIIAAAVLLAVCQLASATPCAKVVGYSDFVGTKCAGSYIDQLQKRAGDITKLNLYFDGTCVTGIKPTYGFKSSDSQLLGVQKGEEKDLKLPARDHIKTIEVKVGGSCIEYLKVYTWSGAELAIGKYQDGLTTITAPVDGAYVYGIRGYSGDAGACQLQVVWATDKCEEAVTKPAPVPVPTPVDVPVPKPVDVPVPKPVDVPVPKPVDVPVPKPVDVPTPVPTPTPVPIPTPVPTPNPIPNPIPTPVPTPNPIDTPVPVPVPKPVDVPNPVPIPTPVPVPTPVPIPTPVPVTVVTEVEACEDGYVSVAYTASTSSGLTCVLAADGATTGSLYRSVFGLTTVASGTTCYVNTCAASKSAATAVATTTAASAAEATTTAAAAPAAAASSVTSAATSGISSIHSSIMGLFGKGRRLNFFIFGKGGASSGASAAASGSAGATPGAKQITAQCFYICQAPSAVSGLTMGKGRKL